MHVRARRAEAPPPGGGDGCCLRLPREAASQCVAKDAAYCYTFMHANPNTN